jgi:hypothetical protein
MAAGVACSRTATPVVSNLSCIWAPGPRTGQTLASLLTANQVRKRPYKRNLIAVGLLLLALGAYTIYDSNSASFYHSTFNLLPSKFFKITDNLKDTTTLNGQIKETSGMTVTFLIMNSQQFAAFQIGQGNTSLYAVKDVTSSSVSFTFPTADTYYLVFLHGSGYLTATEPVDFQRTYLALARFEFFSGIALVGLGVLEMIWGLRPRDSQRSWAPPKQAGASYGQP